MWLITLCVPTFCLKYQVHILPPAFMSFPPSVVEAAVNTELLLPLSMFATINGGFSVIFLMPVFAQIDHRLTVIWQFPVWISESNTVSIVTNTNTLTNDSLPLSLLSFSPSLPFFSPSLSPRSLPLSIRMRQEWVLISSDIPVTNDKILCSLIQFCRGWSYSTTNFKIAKSRMQFVQTRSWTLETVRVSRLSEPHSGHTRTVFRFQSKSYKPLLFTEI